jgi:hypothetical protein
MAANAYTVQPDDTGGTLAMRVTAVNGRGGPAASISSNALAVT